VIGQGRRVLVGLVVFALVVGGVALFRPKETKLAQNCRQVSKYRSDLGLPETDASEEQISLAFRKNQVAFGGWINDLNCTAQNKVTGRVIKFLVSGRPQDVGALAVVAKYFLRSQSSFGTKKQAVSFGELFSDPSVADIFSSLNIETWKSKVASGEVPLSSAVRTIVMDKVEKQNLDIFRRLLAEEPAQDDLRMNNRLCAYDSKKWETVGFPKLNDSADKFAARLNDEVVKNRLGDWIKNLSCSHPEVIGRVAKSFVDAKPQELPQLALLAVEIASASRSQDRKLQANTLISIFSAAEVQSLFMTERVEQAAERVRTGESGTRRAFVEIVESTIEKDQRDEFLFLANSF
jgi:hypothetical protein